MNVIRSVSKINCVLWYIAGGGPRVVVSTAAFHARVRGSVPGLGGLKETKMFLPHPRVKVSIVGSLRDREVACSASDRQGSNFESCVWRTVSSQSSHHPQEVLLAQFSLYVHKGGLKPDSFHFICGTLHCALWYIALWYIALCFVVHCSVLCGALPCALWYITLCIKVHCIVVPCIVLCSTLQCALWYIAVCVVVHNIVH